MLPFLTRRPPFSVHAAHGVVIVSIVENGETRLWSFGLHQPRAAVFAVQERGSGGFVLSVRQPDGVEDVIMIFPDRRQADAALRRLRAALLRHGATPVSGLKRIAKTAGVVVATLLVLVLWSKSQRTVNVNDMVQAPPPAKTGAPVPAEELLGQ